MKYHVNVIVSCIVEAADPDEAHDTAISQSVCKNRYGKMPSCIQSIDAEVIQKGEEHENNAK